ncbi:ATP-dependent DNA ligase [Metabacillus schmidteae]|uniref:ATP-dependent DNA ligase n=1 Tax=Metabacillus schmidteae TaxID=2730405 RepID=UPI001F1F4A8D|nr:hypothetical protein [Metabacillus schmidteae]
MFISPMLLHRGEAFDDDIFISEIKFDGIRMILTRFNAQTRLYTRHGNEITYNFKELLDIEEGKILDDELIVSDQNGVPNFEYMIERFKSSKSKHFVQFVVFDIIYHGGKDITSLPLLSRKKILDEVIRDGEHPHIAKSQYVIGHGEAYFNLVKERDLEGIVMKKVDSTYQINKRSYDWLSY